MAIRMLSRMKLSTVLLMIGAAAFILLVVPILYAYFTEPVFYLNSHLYKKDTGQSEARLAIYRSGESSAEVVVREHEGGKIVTIDQEEHTVIEEQFSHDEAYRVIYPDGSRYGVSDNAGFWTARDQDGNVLSPINIYVDGEKVLHDGEPLYHPSEIITIAYSEYHTTRGIPIVCIASFICLILSWCAFRYKGFQTFLFHMSLYRLWVEDAKPSEFYYFMSKVGGVIGMGLSVYLFFMSL